MIPRATASFNKGQNVELTISGVTLTGAGTGYGIAASGVNGVSIKSAPTNRGKIQNFQSAIFIQGGASHRISGTVLSSNVKTATHQHRRRFPGGLGRMAGAPGQRADRQRDRPAERRERDDHEQPDALQQNGVSLFESSNVTIQGNDCSDNQGWGIHIHRSSNNTVTGNRADNVNLAASTYCHDVQADACDTAGILVIKASNDNLIQGNSFKNGGDGIFSAARQGDIQFGADHNRYVGNDVSAAKHLGIEATFADNMFVENEHRGRRRPFGNLAGRLEEFDDSREHHHGQRLVRHRKRRRPEHHHRAQCDIGQRPAGHPSAWRGLRLVDRGTSSLAIPCATTGNTACTRRTPTRSPPRATCSRATAWAASSSRCVRQSALTGPITVNESQLLDASQPCGGVDVKCGCPVFNGNIAGCNAASGCAYYSCSNQCRAVGTSLCDAGCSASCTGSCRDHDGDVEACDASGCAYYFCSNRCYPAGDAAVGGLPLPRSRRRSDRVRCGARLRVLHLFEPVPLRRDPAVPGGCADACPGGFDCPIGNVTNVTSNCWGTTESNR